ncbi:MAG: GtrA family protein [Vampirovibrio sp.]
MWRKPFKSPKLLRFISIGLVTTLVDALVYRSTLGHLNIFLAKGLAFGAGVFLNFLVSALWNFKVPFKKITGHVSDFFKLYLLSGTLNVCCNAGFFHFLLWTHWVPKNKATLVAWLGATLITALCNYLGQSLWVFKSSPSVAVLF